MRPSGEVLKSLSVIDHEECKSAGTDLHSSLV